MTIGTAAVVAMLVLGAAALATYREYGLDPDPPRPDCPSAPCRATGKTTGYQVQSLRNDGRRVVEYPTKVRRSNGWLVAFSLRLGKPTPKQTRYFNGLWGKPATARVSILDPEPPRRDRKNRRQRFRLHNQSEVVTLNPFFGKTAWFTLRRRMHVRKGQIIALTLPTWGPVLATDLSGREQWRSSRNRRRCNDVTRASARQKVGKLRDYRCRHTTARVLFTALVVHKTRENKSR